MSIYLSFIANEKTTEFLSDEEDCRLIDVELGEIDGRDFIISSDIDLKKSKSESTKKDETPALKSKPRYLAY